ncbi:MAG: DUF413 domain-containing protein [Gammaproteobacteria bacterium]|nr:DUF413 domain-containing protein [Gammaproteobacteria bacterium]
MSSPFVIQCSREIFSETEIEILEEHGARLKRLADGCQRPRKPAGRRFVEVANGRRLPETVYEKVWMKYQQRLELERDPAFQDAMGPLRKAHDDREDWKRMRGATWGEMVRRSRGLDD